jgi:putative transposase
MLEFDRHFHIFNHANGFEVLFKEEKNYHFFLEKYGKHINPIAETIAWCLMPNHFHVLVRIRSKQEIFSYFEYLANQTTEDADVSFIEAFTFSKVPNFGKGELRKETSDYNILPNGKILDEKFLSKQFSNFFSSYSQAFNKVYNRRGSLFIKNFKRKRVDSDDYFRSLILYIHLNPIHHGFTSRVLEWSWTSYLEFLKEHPDLLTQYFGDNENYVWLHDQRIKRFDDYDQIETDINE